MDTQKYFSGNLSAAVNIEKRKARTLFDLTPRYWMAGILMLSDLVCLLLAIVGALALRWLSFVALTPAYDQIFLLLAFIMLLKFFRSGLYPSIGLHYIDELGRLVNSIFFTFVIVMSVTFLLQTSLVYSRAVLLFTYVLAVVLIPAGRYLVRRLMIHLGRWGVPVMIIGSPQKAQALAESLRINLHHGVLPVTIISDEYCETDATHPAQTAAMIKESAQRMNVKDVLVMVEDLNHIDAVIERYRFLFQRVILIKNQTGTYGLSDLKPLDFSTTLGLQVKNHLLDRNTQLLKRVIDVLAATLGMALLAPFLGLVALLIKLDSPGGIFYRQARLGKGGKTFFMLKFRSMHLNAEAVLKQTMDTDPDVKAQWDRYQKLENDPRITRVGKFLRKFSLDELPQLVNIARGEMTLVGPRPMMLNQRELYGCHFKDYMQVTPGVTGLWQVSGRNQTSFCQRAELDHEYIQRWSIWMDFFIMIKTVKVVLLHEGAS